jgi:hypothetical protein
MQRTREGKVEYYKALLHAVQTGIGWQIAIENPECLNVNADPNLRAHKHLRTGIDGSKSDFGALAQLLISKGVFTEEEYTDAIIAGMEKEKAMFEKELSEHFGKNITLG